jgi:hypothetical protein
MDDSHNYAPDSDAPPRNEAEYLAYRIRELERTHRRWKLWILAAIAGASLLLLFAGGFVLLQLRVQVMRERLAAEQAFREAEVAREQAEAVRQQAEAAKRP